MTCTAIVQFKSFEFKLHGKDDILAAIACNPWSPVQALARNGILLGSYPLRVLPSKTAIVPVNNQYLPKTSVERELCGRTVYAANIDKKVDRTDVQAFFESLCGMLSVPLIRHPAPHPFDADGSVSNLQTASHASTRLLCFQL